MLYLEPDRLATDTLASVSSLKAAAAAGA